MWSLTCILINRTRAIPSSSSTSTRFGRYITLSMRARSTSFGQAGMLLWEPSKRSATVGRSSQDHFRRTGYGGIPDCILSLEDGWPELLHKLQTEFRRQRLLRLTGYEGCHDLERPLDWQVSLTLQQMAEKNGPALRALHQGTLHGQQGHCPLCGEDLTFTHLLWQCRFWKGKVKDIPEQWKQRLAAGTEPELWQRGMVQSIFYIQEGGMGTFQHEGTWTMEEAFAIPAEHAISLAVAPTCKDVRHKRYVFVLCMHQVFSKRRVAALKGICPGQATKSRAIFYGLKHLALHSKEKVHVAIFDHGVWKAWQPTAAYELFPDLYQGLDPEDFAQVRPLLFSKKEQE